MTPGADHERRATGGAAVTPGPFGKFKILISNGPVLRPSRCRPRASRGPRPGSQWH